MRLNDMEKLVIGEKIARTPIIQGGMGIGISMAGLASAVANEGGIGVISAAGVGLFDKGRKDAEYYNEALRKEIQKARSMTDGLLGVNIMVALSNYESLAKTAIDEHIDFIFAGAGLPLGLPGLLEADSTTKLVPIISSGRAAKLLIQKWVSKFDYLPDAFVLEGPKAGGHLGIKYDDIFSESHTLEHLLEETLAAVKPFEEEYSKKIPVIAGGGVYSGEDIMKLMQLGASGVQMATRFVTTDECDASDDFKQTYINAKESDIVIIESPVGLPGRAIQNTFLDDVKAGLKHPFACPFNCIRTCKKEQAPYCISLALYRAKEGDMKNGFAFAGVNAYLAKAIITVRELVSTIKKEYIDACLKRYSYQTI